VKSIKRIETTEAKTEIGNGVEAEIKSVTVNIGIGEGEMNMMRDE
jgi:hypothetical protein